MKKIFYLIIILSLFSQYAFAKDYTIPRDQLDKCYREGCEAWKNKDWVKAHYYFSILQWADYGKDYKNRREIRDFLSKAIDYCENELYKSLKLYVSSRIDRKVGTQRTIKEGSGR